MTTGSRAERELLNTLEDDHGFAALRAPSSGGGTDRERPDILAGKRPDQGVPGASRPRVLVIEVKKRTGDWPANVYLDRAEVDALQSFASRFGGSPYVAVRPNRTHSDQDWHVFGAYDIGTTPEGNRAIRTDDLPGATLSEVVGDV
jgi:Holliday junction resolvase